VTIVFISHKLDEVERVTDEVVVMRDGRLVAQQAPRPSSRAQQMANLMVGRELADLYPPRTEVPADAPVLLSVRALSVPGWAQDVSFEVRARRDPRLRRPGRRRPHRAVRRPAGPAPAQPQAKCRWPGASCCRATRAKPPTPASPT
jgi:hypothetical protein